MKANERLSVAFYSMCVYAGRMTDEVERLRDVIKREREKTERWRIKFTQEQASKIRALSQKGADHD